MLSCMTAFAQKTLTEGFYRVQNNGSGRYLYVKDCTGNISTLGADMDALELWANLEDAISDPGSVIYLKKVGSSYDLTSQATGVHELTGRYMELYYDGSICQVRNSGQYLYEVGVSDIYPNLGLVGAKTSSEMPGKSAYRNWLTPMVDSNSNNYFGFKPTITASGKYYTPFFADFAYTPKNDVKTWYVNKVDKANGIAVIKQITGTVAKRQAVFVECPSSNTSGNKVDLTTANGTAAVSNLMQGVYFANGGRSALDHTGKSPAYVEFDANTMRLLSIGTDGKLAFVNTADDSNSVSLRAYKNKTFVTGVKCIPHNQSYLTVDADCPATLKVMTEEEYAAFLASQSIEGDVNGDKMVNMGDVTNVLENIKAGKSPASADVNHDGRVNMGDVTRILEIIKNK